MGGLVPAHFSPLRSSGRFLSVRGLRGVPLSLLGDLMIAFLSFWAYVGPLFDLGILFHLFLGTGG